MLLLLLALCLVGVIGAQCLVDVAFLFFVVVVVVVVAVVVAVVVVFLFFVVVVVVGDWGVGEPRNREMLCKRCMCVWARERM